MKKNRNQYPEASYRLDLSVHTMNKRSRQGLIANGEGGHQWPSAPSMLARLFHVVALGVYIFSMWYDCYFASGVFMKTKLINQEVVAMFNHTLLYKCLYFTSWNAVSWVDLIIYCFLFKIYFVLIKKINVC